MTNDQRDVMYQHTSTRYSLACSYHNIRHARPHSCVASMLSHIRNRDDVVELTMSERTTPPRTYS